MKIGLLGHGVVGGGVTSITDSCAARKVRRLEVTRILVKDATEMTDPRCTLNPEDILADPDIEVIAECMGGLEPAHTYVSRALEAGKHVVTSNKKMFAAYCRELFDLARENGVTIRFEASCGGGIPWIHAITRTRRLEKVNSFRGIFNGTTNYILSRMAETQADFAQCLKEAQKLGYAEKNPTEDINGLDTRFKSAITSLKAFDAMIDSDAIPTYGISGITLQDLSWAKENGCTIKLMAGGKDEGETVNLWVMPVILPNTDFFTTIPMNYNAMESNSDTLGKAAYVGQGAGALPTAHAVVQDLLDIYQSEDTAVPAPQEKAVNNDSLKAQFYVRAENIEPFHTVCKEKTADNAVITKEISFSEIDQLLKEQKGNAAFVAMVQK